MDGKWDSLPVGATRDKLEPKRKSNRRFYIGFSILIVALATAVTLAYPFYWKPASIDDNAQESAATAYLKDVQRLTHGGIQLDTDAISPISDRSDGAIQVALVVGDCTNVGGSIDSPRRPKSKNDLGALRIDVPGSNRFAPDAYPIVHFDRPGWSEPLTRGDSGLSHCLPKK